MRWIGPPAACLLAALACGPAAPPPEPGTAAEPDTVEMRLLRTIFTGVPQGTDAARMRRLTDPTAPTPQPRWTLARAALAVLGEDRGWPEYPIERLLDEQIGQLQRFTGRDVLPRGDPPGFGDDDLVYTLLHTLAVTGRLDRGVEILEAHLGDGGEDDLTAEYVRGVVLQALFIAGTPRAKDLIQKAAEKPDALWILSSNLVPYRRFPTLAELASHRRDIPPAKRDRKRLFAAIGRGCSSEALLALYLAGFLPPAADPAVERREIEQLSRAAWDLPAQGCFNGRYFAQRSLGLRAAATPAYWRQAFEREEVAWNRELLARIAFARHGREWADTALDLLADEPVQLVQWELLLGSLQFRRGLVYRDFWDLWLAAPHRQFRLSFAEDFVLLPPEEEAALLDWLEAGHLPADERVHLFLLRELSEGARGHNTYRFLRHLWNLPRRYDYYDALWHLSDPAALPFLRYSLHDPEAADHRDRIESAMAMLEGRKPDLFTGEPVTLCCDRTEECLLGQFHDQIYRRSDVVDLTTPDEVIAWLEAGSGPQADLVVEILDELASTATITDPATNTTYRFEHLYGCWRHIPDPRQPLPE